jgi:hypothetical protein
MFTTEEGTEDHCQVGSPLLSAQRTFDWLQETSAAHPPQHRISRQGRQPPPRAPADTSRGNDPRQPARAEMRASRRRIFMRWMACSLAIQATLPCCCNRLPRSNSIFGVKPDRCFYVCQGFLWQGFRRVLVAAAEGGQDRDGPLLAEGRLLSGHEIQQLRKGPGRPADRSKASTSAAAD